MEWRAERFESADWPSARIVCARFESFNEAVVLAGYMPNPAPLRQRSNLAGPETILEAFIAWTRRYGDIPTTADWDPARARRLRQDWRIARYLQGDWPSGRSVATHFGSFTNAAVSAGLIPRGAPEPSMPTDEQSGPRIALRRRVPRHQAGIWASGS